MELNEGRIHIGNLDSRGGPVSVGGHIVDQRGRAPGLLGWRVTVAWAGAEETVAVFGDDAGHAAQMAAIMVNPPPDVAVVFTVVPA